MKINLNDIHIEHASEESANDWTIVFAKGLTSFRWMSKFFKEQDLNEVDISVSFTKDIQQKKSSEIFLIAYLADIPVGIIRLEEHWLPNTMKILSHFPLVLPKYQEKGIGSLLVKKAIEEAKKMNYHEFWAECWSMDYREIQIYKSFYEKNGFKLQSRRYEMNWNLERYKPINIREQEITIESNDEVTNQFVEILSASYSQSQDKLHIIENLGKPDISKNFLIKTKEVSESVGLQVKFEIAKLQGNPCAALMIGSSTKKGIVLEIGVLPKYRNMGIAKTMIVDYLARMKAKGAHEVLLGVDQENTPAVVLYEKLGFKKTWHGALFLQENLD